MLSLSFNQGDAEMPHSNKIPGLRLIFATNLRRFSDAKGSVALVCRETGINRQQFNRYLSGQSLPGKRLLNVLTKYFDASEAQFFENASDKPVALLDSISVFSRNFHNKYKYNNPSMLLDGFYFIYHPTRNDIDYFNRGLVLISKNETNLTFTFYATSRNSDMPSRYVSHYRYDGFVTETDSVASLFGLSKYVPGSSYLMLASRMSASEPRLLTGLSLSARPKDSICTRYIMEYANDPMPLRKMMRMCGTSRISDAKLDPAIGGFLKNCSEDNSFLDTYAQIGAYVHEKARRQKG
jgi:transcriptional regulator with XRE-family HTH domain